jgi:hypothetical protein
MKIIHSITFFLLLMSCSVGGSKRGEPFQNLFGEQRSKSNRRGQNRYFIVDGKIGTTTPIPSVFRPIISLFNNIGGGMDKGDEARITSGQKPSIVLEELGIQAIRTAGMLAWFFSVRSLLKTVLSAGEWLFGSVGEGMGSGSRENASAARTLPPYLQALLSRNVAQEEEGQSVTDGDSSSSSRDALALPPLNPYEVEIAATAVADPNGRKYRLAHLGGLDELKVTLADTVQLALALATPTSSSSSMYTYSSDGSSSSSGSLLGDCSTSGILLYGPPGCGKTLLTRAIAAELGVPIIHVTPSLLLRKWVGDTSLLTRAVFTLARKLQPCIVFVDEIDSLLRGRSDQELSVDRNLKIEFMTLWDELDSAYDVDNVQHHHHHQQQQPQPQAPHRAGTSSGIRETHTSAPPPQAAQTAPPLQTPMESQRPRVLVMGATNRPQVDFFFCHYLYPSIHLSIYLSISCIPLPHHSPYHHHYCLYIYHKHSCAYTCLSAFIYHKH